MRLGSMRLWIPVVVVAVISALGAGFAAPSALADCGTEHTIFWGAWDASGGHFRASTDGTQNWIVLQKRTLDMNTACYNHGVAWSTAHVALNGNNSNLAELGFSEHLDGSGNRFLTWFDELCTDGGCGSGAGDHTTWPCQGSQTPAYGTNLGFRVQNVAGTNDWAMYINCNDGSGWHHADTLTHGGVPVGIPMGETGRREQVTNATGMMDDQSSLNFYKSGSWSNPWNFPKCFDDPAGQNNWEGVKVMGSPTEYFTQQGSGSCSP